MPDKLPNLVIAGVNKAGTTSLFSALARHPDVETSDVKETCFFLPVRYHEPMSPLEDYRDHFRDAGDAPVIMEATPGYFYGAQVAAAIDRAAPGVRVVIVLREPVSRLESFFRFQKAMLNLPEGLSADEYVAQCRRYEATELATTRSLNPWFGVEGGRYSRYLDPWLETFGDRVSILFFDDVVDDVEQVVAKVGSDLGLDPAGWTGAASRENRTIAPRRRSLHRVALTMNRTFERQLRRHPEIKRRTRALYERLNTSDAVESLSPDARASLHEFYAPSNREVARQLSTRRLALPPWLG